MRGEDDEFLFEGGIGAGQLRDHVGGGDRLGDDGGGGLEGSVKRKVGHGLAVFTESSDFREGVTRTSKKQFGGGGIERDGEVQTLGFIEFGVRKIHGREIAVHGDARPGNVHGGGIGDGDVADGSGFMKSFPALAERLVMRGERSGNVGRRTREIHNDFAVEVQAAQFVEIFLGDLQAITNKDKRSGDACGGVRPTRADECFVGEGEMTVLPFADEGESGLGLVHTILRETDGLIKAFGAGWLKAGFFELLNRVGLRFLETLAAGVPAFERVVGEELDVCPPGIAIEMKSGRWLGGNRSEKG